MIGMSHTQLLEFIKSGAFTSTKVGSHYHIAAADVTDSLERRNAAAKLTAVAIR